MTVPGELPPQLICTLIAIDVYTKHERNVWGVVSSNIPDFTTLGRILTFPGRSEKKLLFFSDISVFFLVTFELRKIHKNAENPLVPGVKTHRIICIFTQKVKLKVWPGVRSNVINGPGRPCCMSVDAA